MTQTELTAIVRGLAPALRDLLAEKAGTPGVAGVRGQTGLAGPPGRDGRDGLPGLPGEKGLDGTAGRDGADGLGFDDLTVEHDGERAVTFRFQQGDRVKEFVCVLPTILDRGVYGAGQAYEPGDAVSYGGSLWIAQEPTTAQPGTSKAWRLAVKHGREGKAGPSGPPGQNGKDGRDGRNLTAVGPGGEKY